MTITKIEFEHAKPYIKQVSGFPDFIHKIEYEYLAYKEFPSTAPNIPDGKCTLLQQMISTCTYSDPSASDYDSSNPYLSITNFTITVKGYLLTLSLIYFNFSLYVIWSKTSIA